MTQEEPLRGIFPDTSEYDDIIHLPRPAPRRHQPMPMEARAAQFAPFAAVHGHKEAIAEEEQQS